MAGRVALRPLTVQQSRHVQYDHDVEDDQARVQEADMMGVVLKFQGQVEARRNHRQPFGPMFALP